jgi:hypothetical protein
LSLLVLAAVEHVQMQLKKVVVVVVLEDIERIV